MPDPTDTLDDWLEEWHREDGWRASKAEVQRLVDCLAELRTALATRDPLTARLAWRLFRDWESNEDFILQDRGVYPRDHEQVEREVAERRAEVEKLFGPEPTDA